MSFRQRVISAVIGAATVAVLGLSASPASASVSDGFVSGGGDFDNDWGDEGPLSMNSNTRSNATCLWQQILWAEGANEQNGTDFDASDIDGVFGENTRHATMDLQRRWKLEDVDGIVGPDTFGYLDGRRLVHYDGSESGTLWMHYNGPTHHFYITRSGAGRYGFWEGSDNDNGTPIRYASYTSRNCS
ncbi:peptidoglycan-binding protein [Streptomyces sp. NPDC014892]|uniref:peptidoglycan-binding domain-containing protein n=1 Tax=Streptomyces sp. NPDC014892 TaxID=3364930 RepID=UPI0036F56851